MSKLTSATALTRASAPPNQRDFLMRNVLVMFDLDHRTGRVGALRPRLLGGEQVAGLGLDLAQRHQSLSRLHVEARHGAHQRLQIRMLGPGVDVGRGAALHHLAVVHDHDLLGHIGDDAEIVGDEQEGHAELLLQILDELEDLRLDRDVERGRGLVGDEEGGIAHERHRDHRALAQPARELERIGAQAPRWIGEPDEAQHLLDQRVGLLLRHVAVEAERLGDLVADRVQRRERRHRLLEYDRDAAAADRAHRAAVAPELGDVGDRAAVVWAALHRIGEQDLALDLGDLGQDPHDRLRDDGLARARFAHERNRAALRDGEGHAAHRPHQPAMDAEIDAQIADCQQIRHARSRNPLIAAPIKPAGPHP